MSHAKGVSNLRRLLLSLLDKGAIITVMNNAAQILKQFNKLYEIPDAYSLWSDYRNNLTSFIRDNTSRGENALILGAGLCNDIDIEILASHFSDITISDRDTALLEKVCKRNKDAGIKVAYFDIPGITEDLYEAFIEKIIAFLNFYGVSNQDLTNRFICNLINLTLNECRPEISEIDRRYDNIICVGVHSQLISKMPMLLEALPGISMNAFPDVSVLLSSISTNASLALNEYIFSHAKNRIIAGYEKSRIEENGPIEGAMQGYDNICHEIALGSLRKTAEASLLWPFNPAESKSYTVDVLSCSII